MGPPVFLYYRLTNFYQNHRRYVQSLELEQLKGTAVPNSTISGSVCSPLAIDPATGKAYYPCGLIANSMFNDTIGSPVLKGESDSLYDMTNKGIAWASDKALIQKSQYNQWQVVPPPNWKDYDYEKQGIPDLHDNEEFMVWMRTAGLPSFSKLSRRNDTTAMRPGRYQLDINYSMSRLSFIMCFAGSVLTPAQNSTSRSTRAPSRSCFPHGQRLVARIPSWVSLTWLLAESAFFWELCSQLPTWFDPGMSNSAPKLWCSKLTDCCQEIGRPHLSHMGLN